VSFVSSIETMSDHRVSDRLAAAVQAITPEVGPNQTAWPGLVTYRFTRPQASQWAEVQSLALCSIVNGRKRIVIGEDEYLCGPGHYALLSRGMRFETSIVEASEDEPYLSFLLLLDPAVVDSVLVDLAEHQVRSPAAPRAGTAGRVRQVSAFDDELESAILRFLRSLDTAADRRVLAPMRLREITYRLMQLEQLPRLLEAAAMERDSDPVRRVMRYIEEHLAEPLTVADMARYAALSQSALTARFVEATGVGPYQYAKRMRLDRARALLVAGELTVSQIAREVGYSSLSYFINEFKRQFATTPGAYAKAQRRSVAMRVEQATRWVA
jgi:AraC-like DNA-binding protein